VQDKAEGYHFQANLNGEHGSEEKVKLIKDLMGKGVN
jgi:hypothetical protein